jgi:TupA-like ATPgrasp
MNRADNQLKHNRSARMFFFRHCFRYVLESVLIIGYQSRRFLKLQTPSAWSLRLLQKRIRKPQTFKQKTLYKIANDRSPALTLFADKLAVRTYVTERVGAIYLTEIYAKFQHKNEFVIENLPQNFVLKPNHVSGAALIVGDFIPENTSDSLFSSKFLNKYYVNPNRLDVGKVRNLIQSWLKINYFGYHKTAYPEWAYKNIQPGVYAEELLSFENQPPQDFRFFTFNGKCQVIMIDTPGYIGVRRDIYTPNWEKLDVQLGYPGTQFARSRPADLSKMIEIAEALAEGTDHLRVDLYNLNGRIIFGELTNYHAGGTQRFTPDVFDYKLGSDWNPKDFY